MTNFNPTNLMLLFFAFMGMAAWALGHAATNRPVSERIFAILCTMHFLFMAWVIYKVTFA